MLHLLVPPLLKMKNLQSPEGAHRSAPAAGLSCVFLGVTGRNLSGGIFPPRAGTFCRKKFIVNYL